MNRSPFHKQELDKYRHPQRTTERQLQGEQFLRGLDGKLLDPRITEVLYANPFALEEMAAGRLIIYKVPVRGRVKDLIAYYPSPEIQE